jgi:hypothetical protein
MRAANKHYRWDLAAGHGTFLGRFLIGSAHDRCGALCTKLEMDVL